MLCNSREKGDECSPAGPPVSEREAPVLPMPPVCCHQLWTPKRARMWLNVETPRAKLEWEHMEIQSELCYFFCTCHWEAFEWEPVSRCQTHGWQRGRTASAVSDAGARGRVVDSLSGVELFLGRQFSSLLPRTEAYHPSPLPNVVPPSVKKCLSYGSVWREERGEKCSYIIISKIKLKMCLFTTTQCFIQIIVSSEQYN